MKGKNIIELNEEEFCSGPPYTLAGILAASNPSIAVFGIGILISISWKFRVEIYACTAVVHPFDRDECDGEYDVFIAFANTDEDLGMSILEILEEKGCKVCYHERDFIPGMSITENIVRAVKKSKRTLCLVTENFIQSGCCTEEFRQSHNKDIRLKKRRLVVLLVDPSVIEMDEISMELRDYLSRYTYIKYQSESWMDRLMYDMPINRMKVNDEEIVDASTTQDDGDDDSLLCLVE